jgi:hypothetical protein
MASTGRFERRILASAFLEFYYKISPNHRGTRCCPNPSVENQVYVFFALPYNNGTSYEVYKETRRQMLLEYLYINKHLNTSLNLIIGIAFETRSNDNHITREFFNEGQDFCFLDTSEWGMLDQKDAKKIHDEYVNNGKLSKREEIHQNFTEFPNS